MLWRTLAWPIIAVLACVVGWQLLFMQLDAERRAAEFSALREVETLANEYAEQVYRAIDTVEQAARQIKYQWEISGGQVHLGHADDHGLFVHPSRMVAYVVDANGIILTSSAPPVISTHAITETLARLGSGKMVSFLVDELPPEHGHISNRARLLFAWDLSDKDGKLKAAVIIAVDPAYFTTSYSNAIYRSDGLLAIVGDDGVTRVLRMEGEAATVRSREFIRPAHLPGKSGSAAVAGEQWFADGRNRIIGWQHLDRRGASVVVGFDRNAVLAPYHSLRTTWLRSAAVATLALALSALLVTAVSIRLMRRNQELNLIRTTYRMATESSNEGFYMVQPIRDEAGTIQDFKIIDCNRRAAELIARQPEDLFGKQVSQLYAPDALKVRLDLMRRAMESGYLEEVLARPDERFPAHWVSLKLMRYGDNLAVSARDVSQQRLHEEELLRRGNEDSLTGIPNRYWAETHLPEAIARAQQAGTLLALLFVDLDGFKTINDSWGHHAGDEVLRLAARRLKETIRPHDCVARFGGDEFLVILPDIRDESEAARISERILRALCQTWKLSYGDYNIEASIGISVYPNDGKDARTLLHNADIAMFSVKTAGKGAYRFFDRKFHDQLKARLEQMHKLRHAIASDEFVMYYQPRVRLSDGAVSSFEALIRWAHPKDGMISPAAFMPLVEENELVLQLGEIVIDKVCTQLALWIGQGAELVPVSINISPRQFIETDVAGALTMAMQRHRVPAQLIEIELTESSMMHDSDHVLASLRAIQNMGVKVLVDDFGTGYSSLSQLYKFKCDGLKIDRAFVQQLGTTEGGKVIVKAIITMARALGMHVVAEGVESAEQLAILRSLGCDEVQGFLISEPKPAGCAPALECALELAQ